MFGQSRQMAAHIITDTTRCRPSLVTYFEKLVRSAESHCGEFRGQTTITRGAALMQTNEVPKISNLANISDFICI